MKVIHSVPGLVLWETPEDFGFKPYDKPRRIQFLQETAVYNENGWVRSIEESDVVGETEVEFVTKIFQTQTEIWDENGKNTYKHISYTGIHKSRFVQLSSQQPIL